MPVEIIHYNGKDKDPWRSYHYSGDKTSLGSRWQGNSEVADAKVLVTSDTTSTVIFNLKDGCVMSPRFKRRQGPEEIIDVYRVRLTQGKMDITMSVGDKLTFSIPNEAISIRVYEPRLYTGFPASP